jgi:NAD(P)-dependent dehydrogenase (short-subunit alcohol dehydrogenase family)
LVGALAGRGWTVVSDARSAEALAGVGREIPGLIGLPGDVRDAAHREALAARIGSLGGLNLLVNNASSLGPSPLPPLLQVPLAALTDLLDANVVAPLALVQVLEPLLVSQACIVNVTSDAAVEGYPGWGAYGASKAALDQVSIVLAEERPDLVIYSYDPGDMRTAMHQAAFPGEDVSDRPLPDEAAVPAFLRLIDSGRPSGRYRASDILSVVSP